MHTSQTRTHWVLDTRNLKLERRPNARKKGACFFIDPLSVEKKGRNKTRKTKGEKERKKVTFWNGAHDSETYAAVCAELK